MNETLVVAGIEIEGLSKSILSAVQILPGHVDNTHEAVCFSGRSSRSGNVLANLYCGVHIAPIRQAAGLLKLPVCEWCDRARVCYDGLDR